MASLADIPPQLLDPAEKTAFVTWIIRAPITYGVRRALARLWSATTDRQLTSSDWQAIKAAPES